MHKSLPGQHTSAQGGIFCEEREAGRKAARSLGGRRPQTAGDPVRAYGKQEGKWILTKPHFSGYNVCYTGKSCEGKSKLSYPVREPWLVEMGTVKEAEHGPGAGMSICSHSRVRPLKRFEAKLLSSRTSLQTGVAIPRTFRKLSGIAMSGVALLAMTASL